MEEVRITIRTLGSSRETGGLPPPSLELLLTNIDVFNVNSKLEVVNLQEARKEFKGLRECLVFKKVVCKEASAYVCPGNGDPDIVVLERLPLDMLIVMKIRNMGNVLLYSVKDLDLSVVDLQLTRQQFGHFVHMIDGLATCMARNLKEDIEMSLKVERLQEEYRRREASKKARPGRAIRSHRNLQIAKGVGQKPTLWKRFNSMVSSKRKHREAVQVQLKAAMREEDDRNSAAIRKLQRELDQLSEQEGSRSKVPDLVDSDDEGSLASEIHQVEGYFDEDASREMLRKVSHKVEDIRMNTFSVSITELNLVLVSDDGNPLIGIFLKDFCQDTLYSAPKEMAALVHDLVPEKFGEDTIIQLQFRDCVIADLSPKVADFQQEFLTRNPDPGVPQDDAFISLKMHKFLPWMHSDAAVENERPWNSLEVRLCPVLLAMNMNAITTVMRFFMPHGEVSPEVAKEVGSVRRFEATHTSENPQSSAHWNQPSLSSVSEKEEGVMQQQHLDEGLDKLLSALVDEEFKLHIDLGGILFYIPLDPIQQAQPTPSGKRGARSPGYSSALEEVEPSCAYLKVERVFLASDYDLFPVDAMKPDQFPNLCVDDFPGQAEDFLCRKNVDSVALPSHRALLTVRGMQVEVCSGTPEHYGAQNFTIGPPLCDSFPRRYDLLEPMSFKAEMALRDMSSYRKSEPVPMLEAVVNITKIRVLLIREDCSLYLATARAMLNDMEFVLSEKSGNLQRHASTSEAAVTTTNSMSHVSSSTGLEDSKSLASIHDLVDEDTDSMLAEGGTTSGGLTFCGSVSLSELEIKMGERGVTAYSLRLKGFEASMESPGADILVKTHLQSLSAQDLREPSSSVHALLISRTKTNVQHPLLQLRLIIPKERVEEDYSYGTPAPDPEYFGAGGLTARLMGLRFALVARKFAEMGVLVTETLKSWKTSQSSSALRAERQALRRRRSMVEEDGALPEANITHGSSTKQTTKSGFPFQLSNLSIDLVAGATEVVILGGVGSRDSIPITVGHVHVERRMDLGEKQTLIVTTQGAALHSSVVSSHHEEIRYPIIPPFSSTLVIESLSAGPGSRFGSRNDIFLDVESFRVAVSRDQYLFLLSFLENQLDDAKAILLNFGRKILASGPVFEKSKRSKDALEDDDEGLFDVGSGSQQGNGTGNVQQIQKEHEEVRARNLTPQPELEEWRKNYTNARSSSHSISLPAIKIPAEDKCFVALRVQIVSLEVAVTDMHAGSLKNILCLRLEETLLRWMDFRILEHMEVSIQGFAIEDGHWESRKLQFPILATVKQHTSEGHVVQKNRLHSLHDDSGFEDRTSFHSSDVGDWGGLNSGGGAGGGDSSSQGTTGSVYSPPVVGSSSRRRGRGQFDSVPADDETSSEFQGIAHQAKLHLSSGYLRQPQANEPFTPGLSRGSSFVARSRGDLAGVDSSSRTSDPESKVAPMPHHPPFVTFHLTVYNHKLLDDIYTDAVSADSAVPQPDEMTDSMVPSTEKLVSLTFRVCPIYLMYHPEVASQLRRFFKIPAGAQQVLQEKFSSILEELKSLFLQFMQGHGSSKGRHKSSDSEDDSSWDDGGSQTSSSSPSSSDSSAAIVEGIGTEKAGVTALSIDAEISLPTILLPDQISDTLTFLVEVNIQSLSFSNGNTSAYDPFVKRGMFSLRGLEISLETVDSSNRAVEKTIEVIRPVYASALIMSKRKTSSGLSHTHVSCQVDPIQGVISLIVYDRLQATIEKYVNSLALDSSAPSESAIPQDDRELSVDLNISHVNFTLWSDYVAKLALFHLHMKSIHSLVAVNEAGWTVSANSSVEVLINNLNFNIPEPFIENFNFAAEVEKMKGDKHSRGEEEKDILYVQLVVLDTLKIVVTKELLQHIREFSVLLGDSTAIPRHDSVGCRIEEEAVTSPVPSAHSAPDLNASLLSPERLLGTPPPAGPSRGARSHRRVGSGVPEVNVMRPSISSPYLGGNASTVESEDRVAYTHFRFLFRNMLEDTISFRQSNTSATPVSVPPDGSAMFTFPNPFLSKLIDFEISGWTSIRYIEVEYPGVDIYQSSSMLTASHTTPQQRDGPLSVSHRHKRGKKSRHQRVVSHMELDKAHGPTRSIIVRVTVKGMQRFVDFLSFFAVENEMDEFFQLRKLGLGPVDMVDIPPNSTVPLCYDEKWEGTEFQLRCGQEWEWSDPFVISTHSSGLVEIQMRKLGGRSQLDWETRTLYLKVTTSKETGQNVVTLRPPVEIENCSVFLIHYMIPGRQNQRCSGHVEPKGKRSLFFVPQNEGVRFSMEKFSGWSKEISLDRPTSTAAKVIKNIAETEQELQLPGFSRVQTAGAVRPRESLALDVSITCDSRHIRRVMVDVPVVLRNATSLEIQVKQKSHPTDTVLLSPDTQCAFSWVTAGFLLRLRHAAGDWIGNQGWSDAFSVEQDNHITPVEVQVGQHSSERYKILVHVQNKSGVGLQGSTRGRIISLLPFFRLHNQTQKDLILLFGSEEAGTQQMKLDHQSSNLCSASSDFLHVSVEDSTTGGEFGSLAMEGSSSTGSTQWSSSSGSLPLGGRPRSLSLRGGRIVEEVDSRHRSRSNSLRASQWEVKGFRISEKCTAVVPISNLLTLDRVILQADIRVTEAGTSITFSETKHAPFQVFNHTPRVLQMRQAASSPDLQGTTLSMVSSWDGSFVNVLPGQSTEFFWSDLLGEPKVQIRFAPIGERGDEPSSSSALVAPPRRPRSGSIRTRGVGGFRETVAPGLGSGSTASSPDSPVFMERTGAGIGTSTHLFGDSQDSALSGGAMNSHETVQLLGPGPTSQLFTSRGISSSQGDGSVGWSAPFSVTELGEIDVQIPTGSQDGGFSVSLIASVHAGQRSRIVILTHSSQLSDNSLARQLEEVLGVTSKALSAFKIRVPKIEVQMLSETQEEMIFATLSDIQADWSRKPPQEVVHLSIKDVQVDSMYSQSEFEVLLNARRQDYDNVQPNIVELLLERSLFENYEYIRFLGIRLLPLVVHLDGSIVKFVVDLLEVFADNGLDISDQGASSIEEDTLGALLKDLLPEEKGDKLLFFEKVEVHPLEISMVIGQGVLFLPVIREPVTIQLHAFHMSNVNEDAVSAVNRVSKAYVKQALKSIVVILGSLDFLGSPIGAFRLLRDGIRDFFEKPFNGLMYDDSPGSFVVGFASGTASLLKKSTDAALVSLIKITRSLSQFGAKISLDEEFYEDKQQSSLNHPSNIVQGLREGGVELMKSWWQCVKGFHSQIRDGIVYSGWTGGFKGLGLATMGVPIKLTVGALDFVSRTAEGIKNQTDRTVKEQGRLNESLEREERRLLYEAVVTKYLSTLQAKCLHFEVVKLQSSTGRFKESILALTDKHLYLFKPEDLIPRLDASGGSSSLSMSASRLPSNSAVPASTKKSTLSRKLRTKGRGSSSIASSSSSSGWQRREDPRLAELSQVCEVPSRCKPLDIPLRQISEVEAPQTMEIQCSVVLREPVSPQDPRTVLVMRIPERQTFLVLLQDAYSAAYSYSHLCSLREEDHTGVEPSRTLVPSGLQSTSGGRTGRALAPQSRMDEESSGGSGSLPPGQLLVVASASASASHHHMHHPFEHTQSPLRPPQYGGGLSPMPRMVVSPEQPPSALPSRFSSAAFGEDTGGGDWTETPSAGVSSSDSTRTASLQRNSRRERHWSHPRT